MRRQLLRQRERSSLDGKVTRPPRIEPLAARSRSIFGLSVMPRFTTTPTRKNPCSLRQTTWMRNPRFSLDSLSAQGRREKLQPAPPMAHTSVHQFEGSTTSTHVRETLTTPGEMCKRPPDAGMLGCVASIQTWQADLRPFHRDFAARFGAHMYI